MKKWPVALAAAAAGLAATGFALLYSGLYDISATSQHMAWTYRLLDTGMRHSVTRRAAEIVVPPLDDEARVARGVSGFRAHCASCHGAPGVAPEPFALGMTPLPANLVHVAREGSPAEQFWVIKFGIKMSGMPAWQFRMDDSQIWDIVAFMQQLPLLSPRAYRALPDSPVGPSSESSPLPPPDAARGRDAVEQYGCVSCHRIPGLVGAMAPVGPPLDGLAMRRLLVGRLANTPANMQRWLMAPQQIKPDSAMPDLGIGERSARDIAAFLATLQ
jgi:mono/diheme cytochrome c family protein